MGRLCAIFVFLLGFVCIGAAQTRLNVDSLRHLFKSAKEDTAKVTLLHTLMVYYIRSDKDSALSYLQQQLILSRKLNYAKGIAESYEGFGYWYYQQSNYTKALEYSYKTLQIAEKEKDPYLLASSYNLLGQVQTGQKNYVQALAFYQKSYGYLSTGADNHKALVLTNIANSFLKSNQPDSAIRYAEYSYQLFKKAKDKTWMSGSLQTLTEAQLSLGNKALGEAYLAMAIENAVRTENLRGLGTMYHIAATHFFKEKQSDSAISYSRKALAIFQTLNGKEELLANYSLFTDIYEYEHRTDSAFFYQSKLVTLNKSIVDENNASEIQNINFEERLRQQEKELTEAKEKEEHQHNVQYAAITLGVVTLLIGFLVLSHSVIANQKLIRFLGVVSLLIVFEFLNLLLHPWLGTITHHSPVWMLLAMVCVAALLVPLHHKLEHWLMHKLIEKNNKIRLAAAKKTIEQLEGKVHQVPVEKSTDAQQGL
jgi:hypothetical protein